jgi:tetratricopeptide (TPR) repeat protein
MRLLHELRRELLGFLTGQLHGVCVLRGARDHLPFVYRLLQEIEGTSADVFLSFPHRFASAEAHAALLVDRIEASGQAARGVGWSAPTSCRDPRRPVAERVKDALACARELLPRGRDTPRLIVVLCPFEAANADEYAALVRALSGPCDTSPPWFRRMRILVHSLAGESHPLPRFVRALPFDLSPEAMAASARAEAEDAALSPERRAQAQLQAAMLDIGHRRHDAARRRLDALYEQALALKNPVLTALVLSGLGDIDRIERRDDQAIGWYERALVPASAAGVPLVLLMITRHLADLYFAAGRDADAETFFDGAQQLAMAVPEPETQATALIGRGQAQQRRGAPATVWAASFVAAAEVARDNDRAELLAQLRPRLRAGRPGASAELRRTIDALLGGAA